MAEHELLPSASTVHWGYFDANLRPILTIEPDDMVTVHSVSGGPNELPPATLAATVRPEHRAILADVPQGPGPHIMTGPIAVTGALPGDALRIEILDIQLRDDWGYNLVRPLAGALPNAVSQVRRVHLAIDRTKRIVHTPWASTFRHSPFSASWAPHRHTRGNDRPRSSRAPLAAIWTTSC
jgi:acetamidase/formamidase